MSVLNTGKLETMTESENKQLLLIRAENERLTDGKTDVMAILTDDHNLHIREHQAVLADPDLRTDPALVDRALGHIQEHINILMDPANAQILQQLGQQPIMMAPPMPPQGGAPAPAGQEAQPVQANPEANAADLQAQMAPELPQPAEPAEPSNGAPSTAQEMFNRQIGSF
jgi:hypothetical protein